MVPRCFGGVSSRFRSSTSRPGFLSPQRRELLSWLPIDSLPTATSTVRVKSTAEARCHRVVTAQVDHSRPQNGHTDIAFISVDESGNNSIKHDHSDTFSRARRPKPPCLYRARKTLKNKKKKKEKKHSSDGRSDWVDVFISGRVSRCAAWGLQRGGHEAPVEMAHLPFTAP